MRHVGKCRIGRLYPSWDFVSNQPVRADATFQVSEVVATPPLHSPIIKLRVVADQSRSIISHLTGEKPMPNTVRFLLKASGRLCILSASSHSGTMSSA
ncbi:unnamed protein product [Heterobilharzia americana]|nr:unnamed protein product [Heterobilharzia americana]